MLPGGPLRKPWVPAPGSPIPAPSARRLDPWALQQTECVLRPFRREAGAWVQSR